MGLVQWTRQDQAPVQNTFPCDFGELDGPQYVNDGDASRKTGHTRHVGHRASTEQLELDTRHGGHFELKK